MSALAKHESTMQVLCGQNLYVVDWKDIDNGGISFTDSFPDRAGVKLSNPTLLEVCCDKFDENALPSGKKGKYNPQCECVLFPEEYDDSCWVLFIEMKYAKDEYKASDPRNNYPNKMVSQIESTVKYFRDRNILPVNKIVYAIVSFPLIGNNYDSWFDRNRFHDLLVDQKIIIRATNQGRITDNKSLLLGII